MLRPLGAGARGMVTTSAIASDMIAVAWPLGNAASAIPTGTPWGRGWASSAFSAWLETL